MQAFAESVNTLFSCQSNLDWKLYSQQIRLSIRSAFSSTALPLPLQNLHRTKAVHRQWPFCGWVLYMCSYSSHHGYLLAASHAFWVYGATQKLTLLITIQLSLFLGAGLIHPNCPKGQVALYAEPSFVWRCPLTPYENNFLVTISLTQGPLLCFTQDAAHKNEMTLEGIYEVLLFFFSEEARRNS